MAEAAAIILLFPKLFSDEKPVSTLKSQKIIGFVTKRLSHFFWNHFHFSTFLLPELLLSTYQKQTKQIDMKKNSKTAGKTAKKKVAKKATAKKVATKKSEAKASEKIEGEVKEKQVQNRNTTTYKFQNKEYGKGPIVLAVVQHYVKSHPKCTEAHLKEIFPDSIISRYGVFTDLKTAISKSKTSGKKRYFLNPDQLLTIGKSQYAVTNQWTAKLMEKFLAALKEKGMKLSK